MSRGVPLSILAGRQLSGESTAAHKAAVTRRALQPAFAPPAGERGHLTPLRPQPLFPLFIDRLPCLSYSFK
ncbi:hypothetical protein, partial [Thermogemmatispora sp.]|uniref:hypothetical protein n=1 Tax=Thermogemmatispora sp. TaxID=1968838 RepID=UPI00262EE88F